MLAGLARPRAPFAARERAFLFMVATDSTFNDKDEDLCEGPFLSKIRSDLAYMYVRTRIITATRTYYVYVRT